MLGQHTLFKLLAKRRFTTATHAFCDMRFYGNPESATRADARRVLHWDGSPHAPTMPHNRGTWLVGRLRRPPVHLHVNTSHFKQEVMRAHLSRPAFEFNLRSLGMACGKQTTQQSEQQLHHRIEGGLSAHPYQCRMCQKGADVQWQQEGNGSAVPTRYAPARCREGETHDLTGQTRAAAGLFYVFSLNACRIRAYLH